MEFSRARYFLGRKIPFRHIAISLDIHSLKMIKLGSSMKTSILIHTFFIIKPSCLILYYYLIPSIENARVIWYVLPGKVSSLSVFSANEFELNRIYTVPIQKVSFFFLFFSLFLFYFLCRCTFYSSLIRIFSRLTECIKFSFMGIGIPSSECIHMLREECPAVLY